MLLSWPARRLCSTLLNSPVRQGEAGNQRRLRQGCLEFDTLADYRADVEKRLNEQAKNAAENERTDKLIEKVCANATVEIPSP